MRKIGGKICCLFLTYPRHCHWYVGFEYVYWIYLVWVQRVHARKTGRGNSIKGMRDAPYCSRSLTFLCMIF